MVAGQVPEFAFPSRPLLLRNVYYRLQGQSGGDSPAPRYLGSPHSSRPLSICLSSVTVLVILYRCVVIHIVRLSSLPRHSGEVTVPNNSVRRRADSDLMKLTDGSICRHSFRHPSLASPLRLSSPIIILASVSPGRPIPGSSSQV